jgi:hypothetical protein
VADVETGHRSTTVAHLDNIEFKTRKKLHWNAGTEKFMDDGQASLNSRVSYVRMPSAATAVNRKPRSLPNCKSISP